MDSIALARLYLYHPSVLLLPAKNNSAKIVKKKPLERCS